MFNDNRTRMRKMQYTIAFEQAQLIYAFICECVLALLCGSLAFQFHVDLHLNSRVCRVCDALTQNDRPPSFVPRVPFATKNASHHRSTPAHSYIQLYTFSALL